jgi:hypothetical protein
MNTENKNKREYSAPLIDRVLLDNEISLALESAPPAGPGESMNSMPEYFNNDPFKAQLG